MPKAQNKQIIHFPFFKKIFARYLLSRGADVNAVDNEQHSALHWAIVCGELEALDLLHKVEFRFFQEKSDSLHELWFCLFHLVKTSPQGSSQPQHP